MTIIMKYNGGLGNQMFQYAAGISLAQKLGIDVEFDFSFFKRRYARAYEMSVFGVDPKMSKDFRSELYWKTRRIFKLNNVLGLKIYLEGQFNYDPHFEEIGDSTFIEGFFQSEKYFDPKLVKKVFKFKNPPSGLNKELADDIISLNSVSLHVRRGDYVSKARNQKTFNELKPDYYKAACDIIYKNVQEPKFFVFSDSISWAKANIPIENAVYVGHNQGGDSWEDMRLMSLCKHNIIANSSFSWWGAYLNNNPTKLVMAPKVWFAREDMSSVDICPEGWILL